MKTFFIILAALVFFGCTDPFIPLPGEKTPITETVPPEHDVPPEIQAAGSFSLCTPDQVLLLPWSEDRVFDIPRGNSLAIQFVSPLETAFFSRSLQIEPTIGGSWAEADESTIFFIPSQSLAPSTAYTVRLPKGTINFFSSRCPIKLLEMEGSGGNSFSVTPPFQPGETVDLLTDPLDGAYQFRLTFSEPLDHEALKEEASRRISIIPLFPPDAPYPARAEISWLLDRQLIIQYRNMFPDPMGRDLIYRFSLSPSSSTESVAGDIVPEGMLIYLKVRP
jgi:hypothetical protein